MGLIRLIIFVLVFWLVWRMIKSYQAGKKSGSASAGRISRDNMVKCEYCSVHMPESEALAHEEQWFCNKDHKQKYLEGS